MSFWTRRDVEQSRVALAVFHNCDYPIRVVDNHFGPDHVTGHDPGDQDDGEQKLLTAWLTQPILTGKK